MIERQQLTLESANERTRILRATKALASTAPISLATIIAVFFALMMTLEAVVSPFTVGLPHPVRAFINVVIQVSLMTFLVMPWLTPRMARFIYSKVKTL